MTIDDNDGSADSLATPRPFEDEDNAGAATAVSSRQTNAELRYAAEGSSLKALAVLSLGLKNEDGTPTYNPSVLPWSAATKAATLKMTAKELRAEIIRRCVAAENILNAPRPSAWPVPKATEWLEKNPITSVDDIAFIRATIAHRVAVAQRCGMGRQLGATSSDPSAASGNNWTGKYVHLRLIHAIVDDVDIKAAYIRRHHIPSGRMAVENRRTQEAIAANVWHMVSNKWNDKSFSPTTSVKDSHSDFAWPIPIPFDVVSHYTPATPEKVEEKWNAMNLALKRGISNWERSGQGDGGYTSGDNNSDNDDEDNNANDAEDNEENSGVGFGQLSGRQQRALDLRQNFFDNKQAYLLYLWDILDEHNLVQSSMQQLFSGVGSGNGSTGVPSVIGSKRNYNDDDLSLASSKKNKGQKDDDTAAFLGLSASIKDHSNSIKLAAQASAKEHEKLRMATLTSEINARIDSLNDRKRAMLIEMTEPNMPEARLNAYQQVISSIDEEIAEKKRGLNAIMSTPTKSNCSPRV